MTNEPQGHEREGAMPSRFSRRRVLTLVPVAGFAVIAGALALGLNIDPKQIPSTLIGKKIPTFDLPPVKGRSLGLSSNSLLGEVSLVNVFASWCVACRAEHPIFMALKARNIVPLHGLNYKDQPDDAAAWLDQMGDPYTRTGADISGRVAIDFGVYGVPETFVVGKDGIIAYKHIGAVTIDDLNDVMLPMVERLKTGASA